jgi:hypothetical protein
MVAVFQSTDHTENTDEGLVLGRIPFGWFLSFRVPRSVAIWIPARTIYTKMQKPAEKGRK